MHVLHECFFSHLAIFFSFFIGDGGKLSPLGEEKFIYCRHRIS
jgi:hypothetical protein